MKRIALSLFAVAVLTSFTNSANASDFSRLLDSIFGNHHHAHHRAEQRAHAQHLADLEYLAVERERVAQAAHQQPLTYRQDVRLHQELERAAYLDTLEHRVAHATRANSPQYTQGYRSLPYSYGAQPRTIQYGTYPIQTRPGCSPYGQY
ncbi:MAG: hypothetical protein H6822_05500 [Planctomycetaceae bacterium]|nr:hypothetical protein [Planctomycetales bacterium]MCB9921613.1 hypothetical protein [Planctomycetaceae bacterium]